jgi:hypothetical protein
VKDLANQFANVGVPGLCQLPEFALFRAAYLDNHPFVPPVNGAIAVRPLAQPIGDGISIGFAVKDLANQFADVGISGLCQLPEFALFLETHPEGQPFFPPVLAVYLLPVSYAHGRDITLVRTSCQ